MQLQLHKQARTTPAIRAELQATPPSVSTAALAAQYGLSWQTVDRWRHAADGVMDRSHRPHKIKATLNEAQEALVLLLREKLLIGLDDLLTVVREFIEPSMSRSALDRMLRRHGSPSLAALAKAETEANKPADKKTFKSYEPGFIHMDIKYLPKLSGEPSRRYLFVAIDRATRWVFHRIYDDQTEVSSTDFLRRLYAKAPMKIRQLLTDNGSQFTDRFTGKDKTPSGEHAFDKECARLSIEHRLIPPRHPQTNGMVERFNGRVSEVLRTHHFDSSQSLEALMERYIWFYNHHLPQRTLNHTHQLMP